MYQKFKKDKRSNKKKANIIYIYTFLFLFFT